MVKSVLIIMLILLIGCQGIEPSIVPINPPIIDGILSPGEWDAARQESFTDGSQLYLMASAGSLYLGIRSNTTGLIAGNVYIALGTGISILHTSAALGTAVYQQGSVSWALTRDFTWSCRDSSNSEAARAEREAFLQQEKWVGSTSYMGIPEELEYRIQLTGEPLHLAVTFLRAADPGMRIAWPVGLQDDTLHQTPGGLPASLSFSPEEWAEITVNADGELEININNP